jgi:hypothetical protein
MTRGCLLLLAKFSGDVLGQLLYDPEDRERRRGDLQVLPHELLEPTTGELVAGLSTWPPDESIDFLRKSFSPPPRIWRIHLPAQTPSHRH